MVTAFAAACEVFDEVLYFFLCGFAVFDHGAHEVECFAGEGVVGIECDAIVFNLFHLGHKTVVVVVHECDDGAFEDMFAIEFAVDHEGFAAYFMNASGFVSAEGFFGLEGEVEFLALRDVHKFVFEGIEGYSEACYQFKGSFVARLFFQIFFSVLNAVQFIHHRQEFVFCFFHIPYYI